MELIRTHAFARAGLIGNPSDGYFGKTIAIVVPRFRAQVVLYEWPTIEVVWSQEDQSRFRSVHELVHDVKQHGYYGGVRLVKATIRRFVGFCDRAGLKLHDRNFAIRYESNIPRQVGLAGSSGIIVATLRGLLRFYEVDIPLQLQPSLALSVETEELGITAGLQDRVIQVYEGLVFMDFSRERSVMHHGLTCGVYESLDPRGLPPLYLAYSTDESEPTEVTHAPLSHRYRNGDPAVLAAMTRLADLTERARIAIDSGDGDELSRLMDENFEIRRSIMDLAPGHVRMVETARRAGASAKFAGSGGAIVGCYRDDAMFEALQESLGAINCQVVRLKVPA